MTNKFVSARLNNATRVVKNSAFLFLAALLTRGAGLIVAMLVARYLGPSALGTYAVVMGLAEIFYIVVTLGQRYFIIRVLARDQSMLFPYWLNASLVTTVSSITLGILLVLFVRLADFDPVVFLPVYVVCLFLPLEGLRLIALSVLQGLERMEYQTVSILIGRSLGLLVLIILLQSGVGVVAVFIGLGFYQLTAWLVLSYAILRYGGWSRAIRESRPNLGVCRITLCGSFPFATQDFLTTALLRVNTVILPMLVTMTAVGMFSAADRIQQTSAMVIPFVTMAILPTLSRTFVVDPEQATQLLEKALKLLLIVTFPFVFFVTITADQIIPLIYGPGFEAAIPILRIMIWSQIFFVANAVLYQIMMASDNERPMVRYTGLSLVVIVVLTLVLTSRYGPIGAAWALVLTWVVNLGLNAQFVARNVLRLNLTEIVGKPFVCAVLSGGVGFVLHNLGLGTLFLITASSYAVLLIVFRVFSHNELLVLRQLSSRLWQRVVG